MFCHNITWERWVICRDNMSIHACHTRIEKNKPAFFSLAFRLCCHLSFQSEKKIMLMSKNCVSFQTSKVSSFSSPSSLRSDTFLSFFFFQFVGSSEFFLQTKLACKVNLYTVAYKNRSSLGICVSTYWVVPWTEIRFEITLLIVQWCITFRFEKV